MDHTIIKKYISFKIKLIHCRSAAIFTHHQSFFSKLSHTKSKSHENPFYIIYSLRKNSSIIFLKYNSADTPRTANCSKTAHSPRANSKIITGFKSKLSATYECDDSKKSLCFCLLLYKQSKKCWISKKKLCKFTNKVRLPAYE